MAAASGRAKLSRKLNTFDVTNLVVGSIIGADIYIATGIALYLVGPSSLLIWIMAGIMATVIAIAFSYCVMLLPKVGGPYAYVKQVSNPFMGFMVGWALLLSEWFSLAVFPVAFVQYISSFFPNIGFVEEVLLKGGFMLFIVVTNFASVKAAGRTNDALTIVKLSPLVIMIVGGLAFMLSDPATTAGNMTPFFTGSLASGGSALVLIFWAYAGFELSTLPADSVEAPERTIPKAIVIGMVIVMVFYLLTNLVVVGAVEHSIVAGSGTPLLDAAKHIFDPLGAFAGIIVLIVGVGALFSIMGADESGTIGTTRLAYAMSLDGLLPRSFARKKEGSDVPYVALAVICSTAFIVSVIGGLASLIRASVFLLAFVYLATCISALRLEAQSPDIARKMHGRRIVPVAGAAFSVLLMVLVDPVEIAVSIALMAAGVPVYIFFSPKKELTEAKAKFISTEAVLFRMAMERTRFLAHPVHHIKLYVYRKKNIEPAIKIEANGKDH